ncbi:VacJ family lipoprotein, partial [Stenotrophomonas sp. 2YAF22]
MNVVRVFPLILLAAALSACAGKPARSDAPTADTVVPATNTTTVDNAAVADAPAASVAADAPVPAAAAPAPATASQGATGSDATAAAP